MLHINFICLIVLGKLWRKRITHAEYNRQYDAARPGIRAAARRKLYALDPEHGRAVRRAWYLKHPGVKSLSDRRSHAKACLNVTSAYVRRKILTHNPELRGMDLPAAFIESRKEVIHAKRILRKYKRDHELGGQPQVLEDQA